MVKTTQDVIREAIERKFAEQKVDADKFSKDGTFFNETATKVMVIFDNCDMDRVFILVGLQATVDRSWKVTYFKNSAETVGAGHYEADMAMSDADGWLNY